MGLPFSLDESGKCFCRLACELLAMKIVIIGKAQPKFPQCATAGASTRRWSARDRPPASVPIAKHM
jgi:hypothetical protein